MSDVSVTGLDFKTSGIDLRERLTLGPNQVREALARWYKRFPAVQCVILSTCNRVEIYTVVRDGEQFGVEEVAGFMAGYLGLDRAKIQEELFYLEGIEAVGHLLAVAASLESMVIGDAQILSQVKQAYRLSLECGCAGKVMHRLFHCAFCVAKEVYSGTSVARRRVSVAGVAVDMVGRLFADATSTRIAVIGAGKMGWLLIENLVKSGYKDITIYNRSCHRAEALARQFNVKQGSWDELRKGCSRCDIVISSALADGYLFDTSFVVQRRGKKLLIIDIAVPRNFDPEVGGVDGVSLYSIDDLQQLARENINARQEDMGKAREIIQRGAAEFMDWLGVIDIGPLIGQMKQAFYEAVRYEICGALRKIAEGKYVATNNDNNDIALGMHGELDAMLQRSVNRLLHPVIGNIYDVARRQSSEQAIKLIKDVLIRLRDSGEQQLMVNNQELVADNE